MTQLARRWPLTSIGTVMLGATALSGPAFAQAQDRGGFDLHRHFAQNFTPDHRGGGGGGGSGGGETRGGSDPQTTVSPRPPGGGRRGGGRGSAPPPSQPRSFPTPHDGVHDGGAALP